MKNLNELLKEKALYSKKIREIQDGIRNFNKPIRPDMEQMKQYKKLMHKDEQQAASFYCNIKEITEKNRLEKKELEKQKNIYQLAYEMVDINIITAFENLHKKKILNILNKYVKKRVGEKTKEKIENELKTIDNNIKSCYLDIKYDMFTGKNEIIFYLSNFDFEIKINFYEADNWLNENGEPINDIYNYTTANYKYIDDILQLATQKEIEKERLQKEIENEIKAIREKIRSFNNFYCNNENSFKIDEYSIFR